LQVLSDSLGRAQLAVPSTTEQQARSSVGLEGGVAGRPQTKFCGSAVSNGGCGSSAHDHARMSLVDPDLANCIPSIPNAISMGEAVLGRRHKQPDMNPRPRSRPAESSSAAAGSDEPPLASTEEAEVEHEQTEEDLQCACGNTFMEDSIFCRKCGAARDVRCVCGNIFMEDSVFCRKCGANRLAQENDHW